MSVFGVILVRIFPHSDKIQRDTKPRKNIFWSLHCNANNNFLHAVGVKIYQSKQNDSEMKQYQFGLGNISKGFAANNMRAKLNQMNTCMISLLKMRLLISAILWIFINIWYKKLHGKNV